MAVSSIGSPVYNGGFDVPVALTTSTLCSLTITNTTSALNTYNLSTAGVPTLRSTFATAASPVSVALNGNLAYVAYVACRVSGANVLQIIDVRGSTAVLRGTVPLNATTNNVANTLEVFSTGRVLTVAPDGSIGSAPAPSGTAFIQNQTTSAQTGGFNVSGTGTVGGTLSVGTSTTPGVVLTPTTGTHNMLAVAYGVTGGSTGNILSTSGNYTVTRNGLGAYTSTFTAASGLSMTNFANVPALFTIVSGIGFVFSNSNSPGTINVNTYNASSSLATWARTLPTF